MFGPDGGISCPNATISRSVRTRRPEHDRNSGGTRANGKSFAYVVSKY